MDEVDALEAARVGVAAQFGLDAGLRQFAHQPRRADGRTALRAVFLPVQEDPDVPRAASFGRPGRRGGKGQAARRGKRVEQSVMPLRPGIPCVAQGGGAQPALGLDQFQQHAAQIGGVAGAEGVMGKSGTQPMGGAITGVPEESASATHIGPPS